MESWSNEFFEMLDAIAQDVERFCTDATKEMNRVFDAMIDASEEMVDQMQTVFSTDFSTEFDRQLGEFFDPILEAYLGFEISVEEATQPIIHTVDPILNNHPACVGCRHYHGQVYGGTPLICGMHPYGWEEEKCPDWQSTWQD